MLNVISRTQITFHAGPVHIPSRGYDPGMASGSSRDALREAILQTVTALKSAEVPFAVAGGYALYAWGGAEPDHDADIVVERSNLEAATTVLSGAGLEIERPPEDWLVKAWWRQGVAPAFVDVIYELAGNPVDSGLLRRALPRPVYAVEAPVLPAHDVIAAKLIVLSEHSCDFTALLRAARAVREQVNWRALRQETTTNPYAQGFLDLVDRLEIATTRPPAD
jgi:hypothetical protein